MKFKKPELELEFVAGIHPQLQAKIKDLDEWCLANGYPEVTLTHVLRTKDDQIDIYWLSIQKANPGMTVQAARNAAAKKFSWHLVGCAVDIRNTVYTTTQLVNINAHLKLKTKPGVWEILNHDVGRGEHLHVGIRDVNWRNTYPGYAIKPVKKDA